ncbi:MAG TPA: Ig-like domain-containing protein [Conexibacter sp.]
MGGAGGQGTYFVDGGSGAKVTGDLAVLPGDRRYLEVGGNGTSGENYGGGGGGGGASDVRTLPAESGLTPTDSRLLIAAGGGGSGRGYANGAAGSAGIGGNGNTVGGASRQGGSPTSGGGAAGFPTGTGAGGAAGAVDGWGAPGASGALGTGGAGAYIDDFHAPAPGGYNGGGVGGGYDSTVFGIDYFSFGGGGGGGGGGLNGGGGGGGVVFNQGTARGGGGGGGGSNLVPAGGSAATDATRLPSITVAFADGAAPVVSLDAVSARAGAAAVLTGGSGTILGDGDVTIKVYAGPAATGVPVASVPASTRTENGDYSAPLPALADGQYTAQATQVDGAGNVGISVARTFVYDATEPVVSITAPANDSITNDATPQLVGVAGATAGDGASVTVQVRAVVGDALVETVTGPRDATTGAYAFPASPALGDGLYNAAASQSDAAGNVGASSTAVQFTVDMHAPEPTLTAPAAGRTNDATPTFAGTGGTAGGDASGVVVSVFSGTTTSGTPVTTLNGSRGDHDGRYELTATAPLADGTYTVQTAQSDAAGNTGTTTPRTFTVDTTAPAISLTAPAPGAGPSPTFAGIGGTAPGDSAATTVTVWTGAKTSGTLVQTLSATRDPATGTFSVTAPFALAAGTYTAQATQADDVDNRGTSAAVTFTIGDAPPLIPPVLSVTTPSPTPGDHHRAPVLSKVALTHAQFRIGAASRHGHTLPRGTTLRYRLNERATVTVTITRSGSSKVLGTLTHRSAAGAGHLAVSGRLHGKALRSGRYRITIRATDAAGSRSAAKRLSFRVS